MNTAQPLRTTLLPGAAELLTFHRRELPQRDDLCGAFCGALALQAAKIDRWRGEPLESFDYNARGMLVSLGMNYAVVNIAGIKVSGYFAWLFWNAVHLYKLVGLKKQVQVAGDWALGLIFPRDAAIMRRPRRCNLCGTASKS